MRRLLTVLLLACAVVGIGVAGPAQAHNVLLSSDPSDGASLSAAPDVVTLVFDQSVRQGFAQISVTGPDGGSFADGPTLVNGPKASVRVKPLPGAGMYAVGYRILSSDGHPVSGRLTFTFTGAGSTAGSPSQTPGGTTPQTPGITAGQAPGGTTSQAPGVDVHAAAAEAAANGGSGMAVLWIGGALLVLAVGTVIALRRPAAAPPGSAWREAPGNADTGVATPTTQNPAAETREAAHDKAPNPPTAPAAHDNLSTPSAAHDATPETGHTTATKTPAARTGEESR